MSLLSALTGSPDPKKIHEISPIPARLKNGRRVAILTSDKTEDIEFFYPYYRLAEAGYDVDVLTLDGEGLTAMHGIGIPTSKRVSDASPSSYDLLYLPGGQAPATLRKSDVVLDFVRAFAATGKPIAAVCHGPQILVSAGLAKGRTMASWPAVGKEIEDAGGTFTDEALQEDGQFITARYPGDLPRHLYGVLQALEGKSRMSSSGDNLTSPDMAAKKRA